MMSPPDLDRRYRDALDMLPDGSTLLARTRAAEDEYRQLTAKLILENGDDEGIVRRYQHPFSFSGGADANDEALRRLCSSLAAPASAAGVEPFEFDARWWPDPAPSATAVKGQGGLLVRVNTGLLSQLRFALHLIAPQLANIESGAKPDSKLGDEFRRMLDEAVGGEPLPVWWTVRVQRGSSENIRRKAMLAGLAFVLAHELSHQSGKSLAFTQTASDPTGTLIPGLGYSEQQAVAAFGSELLADRTACQVLLKWAPSFELEPFDLLLGAASVLVIQGALFWMEAGLRRNTLAWTHPYPDLRIAGLVPGFLNPEAAARWTTSGNASIKTPPAPVDPRGARLVEWLEEMTGVRVFRAAALKRGLEGTGLTPIQRVAIEMAGKLGSIGGGNAR